MSDATPETPAETAPAVVPQTEDLGALIRDDVKAGYEQLVVDGNHTFETIAANADRLGDRVVAGWARARAAERGTDTTKGEQTR